MFFLILFYPFLIFNKILQSIVNYRLDILFVFVAITLSLIVSLYPLIRSLKWYSQNVSRTQVFLFIIVLSEITYADAIYSLLNLPIIIGRLSSALPEKIISETIIIQVVVEFLAIPLLYAVITTIMRKKLAERNLILDDKFRNNRGFFGIIVLVTSIGCIASYLIIR